MLTGKAKESFEKWYNKTNIMVVYTEPKNPEIDITDLDEACQIAKIIEWLDSVGIFIQNWCSGAGINKQEYDSEVYYLGKQFSQDSFFENRNDAIKWAISKANEIYNNNK